MRSNTRFALAVGLALSIAGTAAADKGEKVEGYSEWRTEDGALVVDGQRVRLARGAKFKGKGEAEDFASIPLGWEIKAKGGRADDGTLLASELEAKPNGDALFEGELRSAFDQIEETFRERGRMAEEDEEGNEEDYGRLREEGRDWERVRRIIDDLVPPYADPEDFRVYVVENKDWNAMAGPNGAIFVFTGLLRDMDDDEVAIVLGHELVHATHEHSRKQYKKDMIIALAAAGIAGIAETIDEKDKRTVVQVALTIGMLAWQNGYSRSHEDQADRVGLRYAFEGGYDVRKGPRLWRRFAQKYGDTPKAINFFLGEHSGAQDRARRLERELTLNYR